MKPLVHLLIIDPQNDFCDLPENYRALDAATGERPQSALPVPGAHADMQRLARFIRASIPQLDQITVTLDSHHRLHIAHPGFWQTGSGAAVPPFTPITAAQLRAGEFAPYTAVEVAPLRADPLRDPLSERERVKRGQAPFSQDWEKVA